MSTQNIIVIGGGAAGLMAAGTAATQGARVLLLEKMASPARKIRITGKGRCNLTNSAPLPEFIAHFGKSGRFLRQAFDRYFTPDLLRFLESRGLKINHERGGRYFPAGNDANGVAHLLIDWAHESGVEIRTSSPADRLIVEDQAVRGVVCNGENIYADRVILACGGASYPRTGSTGDGYELSRAAGHTIILPRPALVPLATNPKRVEGLAGLDLKNVMARLYIDGKRKAQEFGEAGFTRKGLCGPIILTLSSLAVDALHHGKEVTVRLDLKPALDDTKLDNRLQRDLKERTKEEMASVLRGLMPKQLVQRCLADNDIAADKPAGILSAAERRKIRQWLKELRFDITGFGSYNEAIITAGGVKTSEITPATMESRKTAGLYIAGELLDIQADTGGFNLQAAFSTGWVAGMAAAGEVLD